jgi:hypothetical protein
VKKLLHPRKARSQVGVDKAIYKKYQFNGNARRAQGIFFMLNKDFVLLVEMALLKLSTLPIAKRLSFSS